MYSRVILFAIVNMLRVADGCGDGGGGGWGVGAGDGGDSSSIFFLGRTY